jgi:hypothetical protein
LIFSLPNILELYQSVADPFFEMATSPTQTSLKLDIKEQITVSHDQSDLSHRVAAWSPEERAAREKKFVRRIDLRLLPILVSAINTPKTIQWLT